MLRALRLLTALVAFYRGWTNWLRGGVVGLAPDGQRDPAEVARFDADSADLGTAFDAFAIPHI